MHQIPLHRRTFLAAAAASLPLAGLAQERWPARPIRIVVTTAAGGSIDFFARLFGPHLSERLGQPVVVENKPGAGTTLGSQYVADAPADGYTLVVSTVSSHGAAPWVIRNVRYDAVKDFAHVALLAKNNLVLVASAKSSLRNFADVTKFAAEKNGIDFGISANGGTSHLAGLRLAALAGFKVNSIPYRGSGPAQVALLSGEVPAMVDAVASMIPHIKAGSVRPIAVLSAQRDPLLPETPTLRELGIPLESQVWYGISAPKNTPAAVVTRLNREINEILRLPAVQSRYREVAAIAEETTPAQFTNFVTREVAVWRDVVKAANITVD